MLKRINRQRAVQGLAIAIAVALWIGTSMTTAFFWTIFLVWAAWRLDARYVGAAAIVLLIVIPILLSTPYDWLAEQVAVYVYFLLVITVALQTIDLFMARKHI